MYIKALRLKRTKRIRDLTLRFVSTDGTPRPLTVIIGENGTAKTTILQAIALAATGRSQVNVLAGDVVGHLRDRRTSDPLSIDAAFVVPMPAGTGDVAASNPRMLTSQLWLGSDETVIRGADEEYEDGAKSDGIMSMGDPVGGTSRLDVVRSKGERGYFVAAYGVARHLPSPAKTVDLNRPHVDRIQPLFGASAQLTAFRFADYFDDDRARHFASELARVIASDLVPGIEGLELRGRGGVKQAGDLMERDRVHQTFGGTSYKLPAVALAHGYQSTLAWISDVFGHYMLEHGGKPTMAEVRGLVLVDEIDLYLHPRWQRTLIPALIRTFPNVQFVVTTHSPVVLANVAPASIVVLGQDPNTGDILATHIDPMTEEVSLVPIADASTALPDPRVMTGTEVYERFFGVEGLTLNERGEKLREYYRVVTDPDHRLHDSAGIATLRSQLESLGVSDLPLVVSDGTRDTEDGRH
ncbi:MAG: AAA family ATPase [Sandaracinaceae bacterium]|nr:AAA family ATPase [Sandaracinaceae bacterium]